MDRPNYRNKFYNYIYLSLYTIVFAGSAFAQQAPSNTNIAGPSASATGNVTNQAVQVLQGPYAMNTYGNGVACQGATFSLSPFMLKSGNGSEDPESFDSGSHNWGISAGINVPLDGGLMELCKERARTEITRQNAEADKARLDFELVRLLKCGEAMKGGIYFHPQSPYAKICADVVLTPPNVSFAPSLPASAPSSTTSKSSYPVRQQTTTGSRKASDLGSTISLPAQSSAQ